MISNRLAAALQRRHVHYGWVVVAVTFLTMLVTAGALGAGGVLIVPLQKEFGWSTAEISSAIALRILLYGLLGPFAAAFLNRFGLRPVIVVALAMISGGYLLSLFVGELWQLIILWGVVVGVGAGLTALVLGATVATRWFTHRRGLVVGMMTASSATGQLIFLPILAGLTESFGWRTALLFVVAAIALVICAVLVLIRDRPSDVGLPAYGETIVTPPPPAAAGLAVLVISPISALRDAARTRTFWVLFSTFFVCGASTNGLIQTHFISLCSDYGIEAVQAAGLLAVIGAFDFFGTILSGWLSDRYDNRWLLFWYYGLRGLSLALLPFTDFTFYGLSLFAVFYGLDWVATVPPTVRLTADNFGRERSNLVFGWIFAGHQIGAATIAFAAGLSRTELSSYLPAFFAAGLLCLIAALLALAIGRARRTPTPVVPQPA